MPETFDWPPCRLRMRIKRFNPRNFVVDENVSWPFCWASLQLDTIPESKYLATLQGFVALQAVGSRCAATANWIPCAHKITGHGLASRTGCRPDRRSRGRLLARRSVNQRHERAPAQARSSRRDRHGS